MGPTTRGDKLSNGSRIRSSSDKRGHSMADKLFRIILQVDDLDKAEAFYGKLLGDPGRRIPYASRHYIDCGAVILALVDPTPGGEKAQPLPDNIYFAVGDLEDVYARAS